MANVFFVPLKNISGTNYSRVMVEVLNKNNRIERLVGTYNHTSGDITVSYYDENRTFVRQSAFSGISALYSPQKSYDNLPPQICRILWETICGVMKHKNFKVISKNSAPNEDLGNLIAFTDYMEKRAFSNPSVSPTETTTAANTAPAKPKKYLFLLRDDSGLTAEFAEGNYYPFQIDGEYVILTTESGEKRYLNANRGKVVEVKK